MKDSLVKMSCGAMLCVGLIGQTQAVEYDYIVEGTVNIAITASVATMPIEKTSGYTFTSTSKIVTQKVTNRTIINAVGYDLGINFSPKAKLMYIVDDGIYFFVRDGNEDYSANIGYDTSGTSAETYKENLITGAKTGSGSFVMTYTGNLLDLAIAGSDKGTLKITSNAANETIYWLYSGTMQVTAKSFESALATGVFIGNMTYAEKLVKVAYYR